MGPFPYHNHYAAFVEVVLPLALYRTFRAEPDSRNGTWLYGSMVAILYASMIASASRAGAVLATAEVLTVIAIMWARSQTRWREETVFERTQRKCSDAVAVHGRYTPI